MNNIYWTKTNKEFEQLQKAAIGRTETDQQSTLHKGGAAAYVDDHDLQVMNLHNAREPIPSFRSLVGRFLFRPSSLCHKAG